MINQEEKERLKLGQELQETVGYKVSVSKDRIKTFLEDVPDSDTRSRLHEVMLLLEHSSRKITEISRQIAPPLLHHAGLYRSLEQLAVQLGETGKADIYCHSKSYGKQNDLTEIMLYRIAAEIIGNAVRHGKPNRIDIFLEISGERIEMEIRDNGFPFDLQEKIARNTASSTGNGLKNIEGRLQNCRATLTYRHEEGSNRNLVSCAIIPAEVQEMA